MKSYLRNGIIAGLIAGIVGSIMAFFNAVNLINLGLIFWGLEGLSLIPFTKIAMVEIIMYIIWGIILGIIFSKVYDLVPGKGISKGLMFGLIYYLIFPVRWVMFQFMYGNTIFAISWLHYIVIFIPLGLALGISYEFVSKRYISRFPCRTIGKSCIIQYDLGSCFWCSIRKVL